MNLLNNAFNPLRKVKFYLNSSYLKNNNQEYEKLERKPNIMSAQYLDLNLSAEAYESNDDSVGTSDVDSKLTPIKKPTIDHDHSGSG